MNYTEELSTYSIIVHSHLPWDGVWQRPQQFLSRLSTTYPVLFVEAPTLAPRRAHSEATLHSDPKFPNVQVLKMQIPKSIFDERSGLEKERRKLLKKTLQKLSPKFDQPIHWFYDPMAVKSYSGHVNEVATVYDCMDQLSQFKFAPPELLAYEKHLLKIADVVFAGGPKLYKSKRLLNPNCHCYGCGVEVDHFGKALLSSTPVKEDLAKLGKPVLGYIGVVDERIDYPLLLKLADADPNWNVVIIGPTAKVDPKQFPTRANLHWLGRREYAELPAYIKGFDICLMPFALNEATEYINPTKAQEYMAAGKPIVSTAVEDVVLQFSNIVKIGYTHDEFIKLCKSTIINPDRKSIERGLVRAENMTWDSIVAKLEQNLQEVLPSKNSSATQEVEEETVGAI
jgi:glycosyltransferase involved in cell wall biosynthesis